MAEVQSTTPMTDAMRAFDQELVRRLRKAGTFTPLSQTEKLEERVTALEALVERYTGVKA